jgi:uncharacterized membrane protein YfcA
MDSAGLFVMLGFCCGIVSAAFGVGSGLILVPALVLLCGFSQPSAQGTSLAVMVPMSLAGALGYRYLANVPLDLRPIGLIALGAVAGAAAGSRLPGLLSPIMAQRLFGVFLIVVAIRMLGGPAKIDRRATDGASRQGLAHFAPSGEHEMPVPLSVEECSE